MKKLLIIQTILIVLLIVINLVLSFRIKDISNRYELISFSSDNYESEISRYTDKENIGEIKNVKQAIKAADEYFNKKYPYSDIEFQKPFVVMYDYKNAIWIISGTLPSGTLGGTANLIVRLDGTVLASWHDC